MHYVYLIRSVACPAQTYIGLTSNVFCRLRKHNEGGSPHTARFKPWRVEMYLAFASRKHAADFEAYLKTGSGRAFAAKRFWPPSPPQKLL